MSGVGFGMGDLTLSLFLEAHGLKPKLKQLVDVSVLRFSEADRAKALKLTRVLRSHALCVQAPLSLGKFGKQIQSAEKFGATCVAFIGDEDGDLSFSVKWLASGEQEKISLSETELNHFKNRVWSLRVQAP